jgi:hypothetical protein
MNTFWLKVAGIAVGIVVVIVIVSAIMPSGDSPPKPPQKNFYEASEERSKKYLTEPKQVEPTDTPTNASDDQPSQTNDATSTKEVTLYFSQLSEIDDIEAQRLLNVAVPGFNIGTLPGAGYNLAVETCRQILERWPDSWYAYRAKQMMGDMPERFRKRYGITKEEMDIRIYTQQRPGTVAYVDKEAN